MPCLGYKFYKICRIEHNSGIGERIVGSDAEARSLVGHRWSDLVALTPAHIGLAGVERKSAHAADHSARLSACLSTSFL